MRRDRPQGGPGSGRDNLFALRAERAKRRVQPERGRILGRCQGRSNRLLQK